jgi:hypothetical protein
MKPKYCSSSLVKLFTKGDITTKNPQTVEELMMQIEELSERIKQLEIEQAYSQREAS